MRCNRGIYFFHSRRGTFFHDHREFVINAAAFFTLTKVSYSFKYFSLPMAIHLNCQRGLQLQILTLTVNFAERINELQTNCFV